MGRLIQITIVSNNELSREGLKRLIGSDGLSASCLSYREAEASAVEQDDPRQLFLIEAENETEALSMARLLRNRFSQSRIALFCTDFTLSFLKCALALGFN